MKLKKGAERTLIAQKLLSALKAEGAFWSYDADAVTLNTLSDDQLIVLTLRHLDIEEINLLFEIYPKDKIKSVWKRLLVPEGEYLYTLNRFLAWYYFKAKSPDTYLKMLETRRINSLTI